jgi:hypothetical protein
MWILLLLPSLRMLSPTVGFWSLVPLQHLAYFFFELLLQIGLALRF